MQILKPLFWKNAGPGLLAATALALVASSLGNGISWLGGAGLGILSGVVLSSLLRPPEALRPGFAAAGKQILQLAVILLGAGLDLAAVWRTGVGTLGIMLVTISAVFLVGRVAGGLLGMAGNNRDLIAAGTAICGGSAIAAVAPVIGARDEEVSYSVSVVFLFNLMAVVIFPLLGHWLGMTPEVFGVWAGTAVNDTSSVMAAAWAFDAASVEPAALVKMTRTVMIVPVALGFSVLAARRAATGATGAETETGTTAPAAAGFSFTRVFPWFVLGFLLMALAATAGVLPAGLATDCKAAGKFLTVVALSGIGLNTDPRRLVAAGAAPILFGAILWGTVAGLALALGA